MKEDTVAYLRVRSFSEQTAKSLKKEVKKIKKQVGGKLIGAVIDLRNNPGGLLDQAIEMADLFIERGEIVSTGGRIPDSNDRFNAVRGDVLNGLPIVVLINGGSASASEIVAGALQDHKRAVIVGDKSFGKGSVQTIIPLGTGGGAMRLTTSLYYTPSGRSIQAEGIEPDISIPQSKVEALNKKKRASEASLRRHLANGNSDKSKKSKENNNQDNASDESKEKQDYQLSRAIDLLKGIAIYSKK